MKRMLSLMLAITMLFSLCSTAFAADTWDIPDIGGIPELTLSEEILQEGETESIVETEFNSEENPSYLDESVYDRELLNDDTPEAESVSNAEAFFEAELPVEMEDYSQIEVLPDTKATEEVPEKPTLSEAVYAFLIGMGENTYQVTEAITIWESMTIPAWFELSVCEDGVLTIGPDAVLSLEGTLSVIDQGDACVINEGTIVLQKDAVCSIPESRFFGNIPIFPQVIAEETTDYSEQAPAFAESPAEDEKSNFEYYPDAEEAVQEEEAPFSSVEETTALPDEPENNNVIEPAEKPVEGPIEEPSKVPVEELVEESAEVELTEGNSGVEEEFHELTEEEFLLTYYPDKVELYKTYRQHANLNVDLDTENRIKAYVDNKYPLDPVMEELSDPEPAKEEAGEEEPADETPAESSSEELAENEPLESVITSDIPEDKKPSSGEHVDKQITIGTDPQRQDATLKAGSATDTKAPTVNSVNLSSTYLDLEEGSLTLSIGITDDLSSLRDCKVDIVFYCRESRVELTVHTGYDSYSEKFEAKIYGNYLLPGEYRIVSVYAEDASGNGQYYYGVGNTESNTEWKALPSSCYSLSFIGLFPPQITTQPKSIKVNNGSKATFTTSATGDRLTYQWQVKTGSSGTWTNSTGTGNKTATLSFTAQPKFSGRQYRCKVSNSLGAVYSNVVTLTVNVPILSITAQPKSATVAAGKTASFSVQVSVPSGKTASYQWQVRTSSTGTWKNCTATGNNKATYSFTAQPKFSGRQYRCKVSDGTSTVTSSAATLSVTGTTLMITSQPSSKTVAAGKTASFSVQVSVPSGKTASYQWQVRTSSTGTWKNCTATGYNKATYSFTAQTKYSGRQYRCKVSDGTSTVTSSAATITVTGPTFTKHPSSITVAAGKTASFSVQVSVPSGKTVSYQWQVRTSSSGTWTNCTATGYNEATYSLQHRHFATVLTAAILCLCCKAVSDGTSTVTSSAATLSVTGTTLMITSQPSSKTVAAGKTASFSVQVSVPSGKTASYQWQVRTSSTGTWKNCTATGYNEATYSFTAQTKYSGRQYRCKVSDGTATVYSNAATLTVTGTAYRALVIGNNAYTSSPLYGCINDMNNMGNMLASLSNGYIVTRLPNASTGRILGAIPGAFSGADSDDVSLFYYAGHGVYANDDTYLGALCETDGGYVTFQELASALSNVPGKVIVIMDSCHSGASIKDREDANNDVMEQYLNDVIAAFSGYTITTTVTDSYGRTSELATSKFTVIAACEPTESSHETSNRTGIFTTALVEGVGTKSSSPADSNGDRLISLSECYTYAYNAALKMNSYQHAVRWGNGNEILFRWR